MVLDEKVPLVGVIWREIPARCSILHHRRATFVVVMAIAFADIVIEDREKQEFDLVNFSHDLCQQRMRGFIFPVTELFDLRDPPQGMGVDRIHVIWLSLCAPVQTAKFRQ